MSKTLSVYQIKLIIFFKKLMQQYKSKQLSNKVQLPYPLSVYIIRSYSSQPVDQIKVKQKIKNNNIIVKEHQEFDGVVKGWAMKDNQEELAKSTIQQSMKYVKHQSAESGKIQGGECETRLRKSMHRTRQCKFSIPKNLSPIRKKQITDNKSLQVYFRNQLVSLFSLLNRKQDFTNYLKGKKQLIVNPMKNQQLKQKLQKMLQSKGKDKGRQRFNPFTHQQLRSLKYKYKYPNHNNGSPSRKEQKILDQDQQQQSQQRQEQSSDNINIQTWKRKNGVGFNQKIFIVKGGYGDLRKALIERGWFENDDVWSPHFDLKWTTKICDIDYVNLKKGQYVNHFNNNYHLTSKYGITRRLRTLILGYNIDIDKFYPRCFDLGDQIDFQNFIENFKYSFSQSIIKRFLIDKKRYQKLQLKIRIVFDILKRRIRHFQFKVNQINKGNFPIITPQQWQIITQTTQMTEQFKQQKLKQWRKKDTENGIQLSTDDPEYQKKLYDILDLKIQKNLQVLKKYDPQIDINGFRNVWIAKPNFLSRGRGIRCFNNLYDIADYCFGGTAQFVIQKYIQHPLVIQGKKFDIRQWVLIQDYNPPKIWFYRQCYVRFCTNQFSLDNIYNRFIHLTNNSIQKYNKKANIQKSIWMMNQLIQQIGIQKWQQVLQKMKNIVVWSIKSCEGHVLGRKGSCELVGYDFMIDQKLDVWLIQINMSPSMDYSTPVTAKLVKMVLTDTAKVLSSHKKNKDTGAFQCIYRGDQDLAKFDLYTI